MLLLCKDTTILRIQNASRMEQGTILKSPPFQSLQEQVGRGLLLFFKVLCEEGKTYPVIIAENSFTPNRIPAQPCPQNG